MCILSHKKGKYYPFQSKIEEKNINSKKILSGVIYFDETFSCKSLKSQIMTKYTMIRIEF